MDTHKAPNDFIRNIDAISLIIGIPLVDRIVFPFLLRNGIHFTAIKRIFSGFILVAFALTIACITQHYIYTLGPCGKYTEKCINENRPAPINFLVQMPVYLLLALSEIFAAVTGIEYAFTKAPKNMRSLVLSIYWLAKGTGILLAQAFTALNRDPLLVWNYGSSGVIAFVSAILFWTCHRKLDKEEDKLNMLPSGHLRKMNDVEMVESSRPVEMADSSPVEMADNSWPVEMPDNSWPVEMADSSQPAEVVDSMTSAEEEASVHVESKLKRTMTR